MGGGYGATITTIQYVALLLEDTPSHDIFALVISYMLSSSLVMDTTIDIMVEGQFCKI